MSVTELKDIHDTADNPDPGAMAPTHHRWRSRVPSLLGRALQAVAVTLVVIAVPIMLFPDEVYWIASYFALFGLTPEPFLFNAVLLFLLGVAIRRRKRIAIIFLVLFETPTVLIGVWGVILVAGNPTGPAWAEVLPDVVAGVIAAALIGVAGWARSEFTARLEPATYRRVIGVFVVGILAAVTVGGVISARFPGTLTSASDAWLWAVNAAIGMYPNELVLDDISGRPDPAIELVVTVMSAAALLLSIAIMSRSARTRRQLSASDELQLRRILNQAPSNDSLAYFSTRRDKAVVFARHRRSAISYRVVSGIALASGDPIGPRHLWGDAADAWMRTLRVYGWTPAVLAASEDGARFWEEQGMHCRVLGEEAVIDAGRTRTRTLLEHAPVAAARRRALRHRIRVRVRRQSECSANELSVIAELAEKWRDGATERGFAMALSRIGDPADRDNVVVTAENPDGSIVALLTFVPWGDDGLSLDMMRRSPQAPSGTTELMITELANDADQFSILRISLNFAVLRDTFLRGARLGASSIERTKRQVLLWASAHWQLDSLRRANEKYLPRWQARLICWSGESTWAQVALAAASAEGFLTPPWSRREPQENHRPAGFAQSVEELNADAPERATRRVPAQIAIRHEHADTLSRAGIELNPVEVDRTHTIQEIRAAHDTAKPPTDTACAVAGRILSRRRHGGVSFLDIAEDGHRIQLLVSRNHTADYQRLIRLDPGDIVAATGTVVRSRSGELSIRVESWQLAGKSFRPLPGRLGLQNPETRARMRHVDLATSTSAADVIRSRSRAVRALRDGLIEDGYMEVETPILQTVHGGANARPFRTHINAYHADLTLRIAPELALKRLIVGGFPQVFEIGRNFRNEGVDATHNPEFTAMEAYRAFADYNDMRHLAQTLITRMAEAVHGRPVIVGPNGEHVSLDESWPVIPVCEAVSQAIGVRISPDLDREVLWELAAIRGVPTSQTDSSAIVIERMYEHLVERQTTRPTFYIDFPADTSPLARPHRSTPGLAERWDLVAFGVELGTAYSELTDPTEQRTRLTAQSLRAAGGDPEAMEVDEGFLEALEFGMPPTGGLGLGVDRIVMLLTGTTIRQTLTFPFVRPE